MAKTLSMKTAVGAFAALSLISAAAFATSATAVDATDAPAKQIENSEIATSGGGAQDLNGNPVESRTYIGDELPSDLGELEYSGSVSAGQEEVSGQFPQG